MEGLSLPPKNKTKKKAKLRNILHCSKLLAKSPRSGRSIKRHKVGEIKQPRLVLFKDQCATFGKCFLFLCVCVNLWNKRGRKSLLNYKSSAENKKVYCVRGMSSTKPNISPLVLSEKEQSWQIKILAAQKQVPLLINGVNDLQGLLQTSLWKDTKVNNL